MPGVFKILIVDSDNFFTFGLKISIQSYFDKVNVPCFIRDTKHSYPMADLIFWAPHSPGAALPSGFLRDRGNFKKLVIVMSQRGSQLVDHYVPSYFYRHQNNDVLFELLDHFLTTKYLSEREKSDTSRILKLTFRQSQVLNYLSIGMNMSEIAKAMNIDFKTVSSHKRAAMCRLRISKSTDLYKFLINDSLMKVG